MNMGSRVTVIHKKKKKKTKREHASSIRSKVASYSKPSSAQGASTTSPAVGMSGPAASWAEWPWLSKPFWDTLLVGR